MMVSDIRTWLTSKYETKYYREGWNKSLNINTFRDQDFIDQDTQHIFVCLFTHFLKFTISGILPNFSQ